MLKSFQLRRINFEKDIKEIYRVYSSYTEQFNLFSIMSLNSPEKFPNWLNHRLEYVYNDFLVVDDKEIGFGGFFITYDFSPNDGTMKIMQYAEPQFRKTGAAALSGIECLDILFRYYNVRKIYSEVYAFNTDSLEYQKSFGFIEEGRLKEYRYYDGKHWDFIFLSITRGAFYSKYGKILEQNRA